MMLMAASLIHARPLACAAASASLNPARLVPQPPDLVKWVRREGGFVHHSIKIARLEEEQRNGDGLGLGLVASEDIPKGSDLIILPQHIPLRFEAKNGESSALIDLVRQIPGIFSTNSVSLSFIGWIIYQVFFFLTSIVIMWWYDE